MQSKLDNTLNAQINEAMSATQQLLAKERLSSTIRELSEQKEKDSQMAGSLGLMGVLLVGGPAAATAGAIVGVAKIAEMVASIPKPMLVGGAVVAGTAIAAVLAQKIFGSSPEKHMRQQARDLLYEYHDRLIDMGVVPEDVDLDLARLYNLAYTQLKYANDPEHQHRRLQEQAQSDFALANAYVNNGWEGEVKPEKPTLSSCVSKFSRLIKENQAIGEGFASATEGLPTGPLHFERERPSA